MLQPEISLQLKNIKQKVQQLVANKIVLQKQNEQLQLKYNKALQTIEVQQNELQQLQSQLKAIQLLQNNLPDSDKKELEKQIDKHIATLQKTITLLS